MLNPGDEVRVIPEDPTLWPYYGAKAQVRYIDHPWANYVVDVMLLDRHDKHGNAVYLKLDLSEVIPWKSGLDVLFEVMP